MSRVFDHMNGEPEDRVFSRVAREMKASPFWTAIPARDEPAAVHGTVSPWIRVLNKVLTVEDVRAKIAEGKRRGRKRYGSQ